MNIFSDFKLLIEILIDGNRRREKLNLGAQFL